MLKTHYCMLVEHDRTLWTKINAQIHNLESKIAKFDRDSKVLPFQIKLKETLDRYEKDNIAGKKRNM